MKQTIDEILNQEQSTNLAAEQMRMKMNAIIAKHNLTGMEVVHILARITSGYIHHLQRAYAEQGIDADIEGDFQQMLTAYLTSLDMNDVACEVEKMKGNDLN